MILLIISLIGLTICTSANALAVRSTFRDRKIPGYRLLVDVYIAHFVYYFAAAGLIVYRIASDQPYIITIPRIISAVIVLIPAFTLARFALFLTGRSND